MDELKKTALFSLSLLEEYSIITSSANECRGNSNRQKEGVAHDDH